MDIKFSDRGSKKSEVLVVSAFDGGKLGFGAAGVDEKLGGFISANIENDPKFDGKRGQTMVLGAPVGSPYKKLVVLGMGKASALDAAAYTMLGSVVQGTLDTLGFSSADMMVDRSVSARAPSAEAAAHMANGMLRKSYKFDKYKTGKSGGAKLASVTFQGKDAARAQAIFEPLKEVTKGAFFAADLVNEPGNVIYPESMADRIKNELSPLGITVRVLDENDMKALGMNAALAVGQGSARPPRMVVMEYNGPGCKKEKPLALVGKGVTFDTGGISIKPSARMEEMKTDMAGAAAVVGAMRALAGRKARTRVVAIVGLAENMPDGMATRPGDIVTSMSGKTVEINNTDAEGRLVLMDALTYIQKEYNPHAVIDLATLTGACAMALGKTFAGVFSNDNGLARNIEKAGQATGEENWRMPLHADFERAVVGKDADLNNSAGPPGASTAAEFLHAVIDRDKKGSERSWAHIDIAGVARPSDGVSKGYGVSMLDRLVADSYECKPKGKGPAPK